MICSPAGRKWFARDKKKLADERVADIAAYCKDLIGLKDSVSKCKLVQEFFSARDSDLNPAEDARWVHFSMTLSEHSLRITLLISSFVFRFFVPKKFLNFHRTKPKKGWLGRRKEEPKQEKPPGVVDLANSSFFFEGACSYPSVLVYRADLFPACMLVDQMLECLFLPFYDQL